MIPKPSSKRQTPQRHLPLARDQRAFNTGFIIASNFCCRVLSKCCESFDPGIGRQKLLLALRRLLTKSVETLTTVYINHIAVSLQGYAENMLIRGIIQAYITGQKEHISELQLGERNS
jgi:hypothetical protein